MPTFFFTTLWPNTSHHTLQNTKKISLTVWLHQHSHLWLLQFFQAWGFWSSECFHSVLWHLVSGLYWKHHVLSCSKKFPSFSILWTLNSVQFLVDTRTKQSSKVWQNLINWCFGTYCWLLVWYSFLHRWNKHAVTKKAIHWLLIVSKISVNDVHC